MAHRTRITSFTTDDWKSICSVAKNITMRKEFSQADFDDIKQELSLGLHKESHKFLRRKSSWDTFRWRILAQLAGRIKRERTQPSHRYMCSPSISLNLPAPSDGFCPDDHPTLMDLVTSEHEIADGNTPYDSHRFDLAVDVRIFVDSLPPKYRRTCNAICEYGYREAHKFLKIKLRTFYRRVAEIRKRMIDAGLDCYLNKQKGSGTPSRAPVFSA